MKIEWKKKEGNVVCFLFHSFTKEKRGKKTKKIAREKSRIHVFFFFLPNKIELKHENWMKEKERKCSMIFSFDIQEKKEKKIAKRKQGINFFT